MTQRRSDWYSSCPPLVCVSTSCSGFFFFSSSPAFCLAASPSLSALSCFVRYLGSLQIKAWSFSFFFFLLFFCRQAHTQLQIYYQEIHTYIHTYSLPHFHGRDLRAKVACLDLGPCRLFTSIYFLFYLWSWGKTLSMWDRLATTKGHHNHKKKKRLVVPLVLYGTVQSNCAIVSFGRSTKYEAAHTLSLYS